MSRSLSGQDLQHHGLTGNTREVRCALSLNDCLLELGKGGPRDEGTAKAGTFLHVGTLSEPVFTDSRRGGCEGGLVLFIVVKYT